MSENANLLKGYCRSCGEFKVFSSVIQKVNGYLDGECFDCYNMIKERLQ